MAAKLKKAEIDVNEAFQKVLIWFFSFPNREISLSDLAVNLKISKLTASTVVKQLVRIGFLKVEPLGRIWRITCNKGHIFNYSRKVAYNLILIQESGIMAEIRRIIPNSQAVVLFGSYRKGDDTEKSDIDIAVEVLGNDEPKIHTLGNIDIGYRTGVEVNLHIFSRNKVDLNLFANIANGIVLDGFLEGRP